MELKIENLQCYIALCLLFMVSDVCHGQADGECRELNELARNLSRRKVMTINMDYCQANSDCTGIDCNGKLTFTPDGTDLTINFCFGFKIQNCLTPIKVDVYAHLPNTNESFEKRFDGNSRQRIEGFQYDMALAVAYPYLNVTLIEEPRTRKIKFGLGLAIQLRYRPPLSYRTPEEWLPPIPLIPLTEIPISTCKTTKSPIIPPVDNKCVKIPTTPKTTTPSSHHAHTTTTHIPKTKTTPHRGPKPNPSATYGKSCDTSDLTSCGQYEVCRTSSAKSPHGICKCSSLSTFDRRLKRCTGGNPLPKPTTAIPKPSTTTMVATTTKPVKGPGKTAPASHRTIVIVACSVSGIIIIIGIAVTAIIVVRKRRARYADHDILLQQEEIM